MKVIIAMLAATLLTSGAHAQSKGRGGGPSSSQSQANSENVGQAAASGSQAKPTGAQVQRQAGGLSALADVSILGSEVDSMIKDLGTKLSSAQVAEAKNGLESALKAVKDESNSDLARLKEDVFNKAVEALRFTSERIKRDGKASSDTMVAVSTITAQLVQFTNTQGDDADAEAEAEKVGKNFVEFIDGFSHRLATGASIDAAFTEAAKAYAESKGLDPEQFLKDLRKACKFKA